MNEESAKEKWCPHVRMAMSSTQGDAGNHANNKQSGGEWRDFGCQCIASDCMMWRRDKTQTIGSIENEGRKGYCGLAGESK